MGQDQVVCKTLDGVHVVSVRLPAGKVATVWQEWEVLMREEFAKLRDQKPTVTIKPYWRDREEPGTGRVWCDGEYVFSTAGDIVDADVYSSLAGQRADRAMREKYGANWSHQ